jgi:hypothetical protein
LPAEAAASEEKYIESTVLQVLMEWAILGATGRQGLPATAARVWIAAHDFSFVEGELKTLEGGEDEVMGKLVQRIEEWGGRRGPPLPVTMYDHVFLPVNPGEGRLKHHMLVHFNVKRRLFKIYDPQRGFSGGWHRKIAALSWAWMRGVH